MPAPMTAPTTGTDDEEVSSPSGTGEHGPQRHDAGDVDGVERVALILDAGQVDDDVRALDADVRLGDATVLQLVADEVTDDDQVVAGRSLLRREDHRHAALQVEPEHRRVAEAPG